MDVTTLVFGECADVSALRDVMHAAFARYDTDPVPSSALAETPETLRADLGKGWVFYGARSGERLLGTAKTFPRAERLYFGRLSVLPSEQGKGIGRFLVAGLEQIARERGFKILECKVRQSEKVNIQLYERLGFTVVSSEVTVSSVGNPIPTVTMHKVV